MLVNWDNHGTERSWSPPYEKGLDSILDSPPSLEWHLGLAARSNPDLIDGIDPLKDVYLADHAESTPNGTRFFDRFLCSDLRRDPPHKVAPCSFLSQIPVCPHHNPPEKSES